MSDRDMPEDGAVEVDVLPPGELGVEAGAHLEQGSDPTSRSRHPRRRRRDPGQDLEDRALPGAVAPDDAQRLPVARREKLTSRRDQISRLGPRRPTDHPGGGGSSGPPGR